MSGILITYILGVVISLAAFLAIGGSETYNDLGLTIGKALIWPILLILNAIRAFLVALAEIFL